MLIVFIGPPGSGKGTQSRKLIEHLHVPHLSTGEMLREACEAGSELGQIANKYIHHGMLVPDEVVMTMVAEELNKPECKPGCLFDGFPRTPRQAAQLDDLLEARGTPLDLVLVLQAEQEELLRRMQERRKTESRADDDDDTIINRLEVFLLQTAPMLDYYKGRANVFYVDAMQSPSAVFADILEIIEKVQKASRA
jgi:adenylate kinase